MGRGNAITQTRDNLLAFAKELRALSDSITIIATAMESLKITELEIREGHAMAMKAVAHTFPTYCAQLQRGLVEAMAKQNRFGGKYNESHTADHLDRDPGN